MFRSLLARFRGESTLIEGQRAFVIRDRSVAQTLTKPTGTGLDRVEPCSCGRPFEEFVITTGGPSGDPELWDRSPVAVDGWACSCGQLRYPKSMSPETSVGFGKHGVAAAKAGHWREAEFWFTRIAWAWPNYVPAYLDLATALQQRRGAGFDVGRDEQRILFRRIQRAYDDAVEAGERAPGANPVRARAAAYLGAAEMAAEDRVPDRARRALEGLGRLDGLGDAERKRGDEIARYVEREGWRFEDASKVLHLHMQLQGGRPAPIDTPEERARCKQAVEALDAYYAEHSTHWQSLWTAAMGRAALGEKEATLETWRRAVRNHPERAEIAREAALAFLRVDLIAEACTVNREATKYHPNDAALWCNRAVTELLNGDLEEAKRALAESQRLDAADPIARAVGARMAKLSSGGPLPRTLRELERG